MNRTTRTAVACALAAGVALGVTAPGAVARPNAEHVKTAKAHKQAKAPKARKADQATRAERRLAQAQRRLTKQASKKSAYLGRLAESKKVTRLEDSVEDAVVLNITGDREELGGLKTEIRTSDGDALKPLARELRTYRPEVYHTIVNQLRLATRLSKGATGTEATAEVSDLVTLLTSYDADTTRAELRAAQKLLASAKDAVADAEQSGDVDSDEETATT